MSEFHVVVTRIDKIEKHPNADTLSIAKVLGDYPVIFRTGEFQNGDLAVYVPVDAIVPESNPRWEFLGTQRRIKAKRLRGIFSMGLLTTPDPHWQEGQNVQAELGITKWVPPIELHYMGGENESPPDFFPVYTDLEGLRRHPDVLLPGELVVVTEKIHGCNARFLFREGRLWVGSHHTVKKENSEVLWWKVAYQYQLQEKLKQVEDIALYGEIYGPVQDLTYGAARDELRLAFFDAKDTRTRQYLPWERFSHLMRELELPLPPLLYEGPWREELKSMANGQSLISQANHIREGFVVRPIQERWDVRCGRVIFKHVGEEYLLRK